MLLFYCYIFTDSISFTPNYKAILQIHDFDKYMYAYLSQFAFITVFEYFSA